MTELLQAIRYTFRMLLKSPYPRAKTRPETIRTATLILFELNCQMMLAVSPALGLAVPAMTTRG